MVCLFLNTWSFNCFVRFLSSQISIILTVSLKLLISTILKKKNSLWFNYHIFIEISASHQLLTGANFWSYKSLIRSVKLTGSNFTVMYVRFIYSFEKTLLSAHLNYDYHFSQVFMRRFFVK